MAPLQTFLLSGLDAMLCTAEVRPGQTRLLFRCDEQPERRLEWPLDPPPDYRRG